MQIRVGLYLKAQGFVSNMKLISLDVYVWHHPLLLDDMNELLGLACPY